MIEGGLFLMLKDVVTIFIESRESLQEKQQQARLRYWFGHILAEHYNVPLHSIEALLRIKGARFMRDELVERPDVSICECSQFKDLKAEDLHPILNNLPLEQLTYPKRKSA